MATPIPRRHDRRTIGGLAPAGLAADLGRVVKGEVRFDPGSRALYATDASNYRQPPIGVVVPRDADDVEQALAVCRAYEVPVFGRGGGTSLAGQCCNAAVCFDLSKYLNRVLEIDPERRLARVEPGAVLDDLQRAAAPFGLVFGPDPATHSHCTLGGMIGNNSCGVHSVMARFRGPGSRTSDNVESLEVLTYDGLRLRVGATSEHERQQIVREDGPRGEIYARLGALRDRYARQIRTGMPKIPRRVSGYNLSALLPEEGFNVAQALVGTEGTCVLVLEAVVHLVPRPEARALLVLGYPSVYEAADHVPEIMRWQPIGLEGMDDRLVSDIESAGLMSGPRQLLPAGNGWLLVEFGAASRQQAEAQALALAADLGKLDNGPTARLVADERDERTVWKVREAALAATARVSSGRPTWEGWEDAAVPPEKLGTYLRAFRALLDRHHLHSDLYGHFGEGCVHGRIDFDLQSAQGIRQYRAFVEEAADLVVSLGGSLSGEHGDGQSLGELLPKMYGPELIEAFREFKAIWDPRGRMNPGKKIDAAPLDANLRLGADYRPAEPPTHFRFPNDGGSFATSTRRCVGVGACRRLEGGTMCPSFMATREERHSTRGRARMLFEMLEGDLVTGFWKDEQVKEAFDLCLACKGCKGDCPVKVDMATGKAEFLSHYYTGRRRPASAYAFGFIHHWARLGALMPRVANALTQTPGVRDLIKLASGMSPHRALPSFAPFTFKAWFRRRPPPVSRGGPRVILWPDTFNNVFHPETAMAAVDVLERAGCQVHLPQASLCCGRPLYAYGMLETAKAWLRRILDHLRPALEAGVSIVGLEPSCVAVFRDELQELFPGDEMATRLGRQTYLLSEFLNERQFAYPTLRRPALVHGHCHHKAVMRFDAEEEALRRVGLDVELLDSGCCGMAGSFGFERDHYDVSMQIGERRLLPAVRRAPKDTLVVADGFSCRTQIAQATDRRALHLADVIAMAATEGPGGPPGDYPERAFVRR